MDSMVWVKAQLLKTWSTGECDILLDYPGWDEPLPCTVPGDAVIKFSDFIDEIAEAYNAGYEAGLHNQDEDDDREEIQPGDYRYYYPDTREESG